MNEEKRNQLILEAIEKFNEKMFTGTLEEIQERCRKYLIDKGFYDEEK